MKENLLIVSSRGFIGSTLCERYQNHEKYQLHPMNSSNFNLLDYMQMGSALREIKGPLTIIFLATNGRIPNDSFDVYKKNMKIAENMIALSKMAELKQFIYTSSVCVYGRPPLEVPIKETTAIFPSGPYGLSKYATEKLLEYEIAPLCPLTMLRIPGSYGPRDKGNSVVAHLIKKISQGEKVKVTGDGSQLREFLYIDDLVQVFDDLLFKKPLNRMINVSSGEKISILGLCQLISEVLGKPLDYYLEGDPKQEFDLYFEGKEFKSEFPLATQTSYRQGIEKMIEAMSL